MSTFNFRNFSGLFVSLGAVLSIELFAAFPPISLLEYATSHSKPSENDDIRARTAIARLKPDSGVVALVGSSRVREGFDASSLEHQLQNACEFDASVVNLGVSAGGRLDLPFIVRDLLPRKPALLLLSPNWRHYYHPSLQYNLAHYARSWSITAQILYSLVDLGLLRKNLGTIAPTLLAVGLPSTTWFRRYQANDLILRRMILGSTVPFPFRYISPQTENQQKLIDARFESFQGSLTFQSAYSLHQNLFRKAIEDSLAEGVAVIVLDEVDSPELKTSPAVAQFRSDHLRFIDTLVKDLGITYIDRSEMPTLQSVDFRDISHPTPSGRAKLTEFLARRLLKTDALREIVCKSSKATK